MPGHATKPTTYTSTDATTTHLLTLTPLRCARCPPSARPPLFPVRTSQNCRRSQTDTPYGLTYSQQGSHKHCWTINIRPCDVEAPCCLMKLYKFEMLMNRE